MEIFAHFFRFQAGVQDGSLRVPLKSYPLSKVRTTRQSPRDR